MTDRQTQDVAAEFYEPIAKMAAELNVLPASPSAGSSPLTRSQSRNEVAGGTLVFTDIWEAHAECKRLGPGYHVTAHIDGYCVRKTTTEPV